MRLMTIINACLESQLRGVEGGRVLGIRVEEKAGVRGHEAAHAHDDHVQTIAN